MKNVQTIKDRAIKIADKYPTFKGKAGAINRAFETHNKKADNGTELKVDAWHDDVFFCTEVRIENTETGRSTHFRID